MERKQFSRSHFRDEDNFGVGQKAEAKRNKFEAARLPGSEFTQGERPLSLSSEKVSSRSLVGHSEAKYDLKDRSNNRTSPRLDIDDENDVESVDTDSSRESGIMPTRKSNGSKQDVNRSPLTNTLEERNGIHRNVTANTGIYKVGSTVEARFRGKSQYLKGKIMRTRFNGSFDIMYDNGQRELGVARELIRDIEVEPSKQDLVPKASNQISPESSADNEDIKVGSKVEMKNEDGKYVTGKIMRRRSDGSYDIMCHDGGAEFGKFGVSRELIRSPSASVEKGLIQNTRPRSIGKLNKKSTLEPSVEKEESNRSLRSGVGGSNVDTPDLAVGDTVEARYRGKNKYIQGKITRKRYDGSYDILYSDGERELCVSKDLIRADSRFKQEDKERETDIKTPPKEQKELDKEVAEFGVGDAVEAKYRGKRYYSGKITRKRFDGSYDIDYDDGDRELGVSRELIKPATETHEQNKNAPGLVHNGIQQDLDQDLSIGTRIEARFRGKSKFFPGQITKCREGNLFDILYDDGEKELRVSKDLIVSREKKQMQQLVRPGFVGSISDSSITLDNSMTKLDVGSEVEALYHGGDTFYAGKITRKRFDGTFDINYVDGDREVGVPKDSIRIKKTIESVAREADRELFKMDDEGRTFDSEPIIEESMQPTSHRSFKSERPSQVPSSPIGIGDKVECRFRGAHNGGIYSGTVSDVHMMPNKGATYDIQYDDGDRDSHLAIEHIHLVSKKKDADGQSRVRLANDASANDVPTGIGDKVECRFRGAHNGGIYSGTVSDVHMMPNKGATYDIQYDDGDRDSHLAIEHIHLVSKKKDADGQSRVRLANDASANDVPTSRVLDDSTLSNNVRVSDEKTNQQLMGGVGTKAAMPLLDFDFVKIEEMKHLIFTIHNTMVEINAIVNGDIGPWEMHNIVGLTNKKEEDAKQIVSILFDCFQRATQDLFDSEVEYSNALKILHTAVQHAMACKQSVDVSVVANLNRAVNDFERVCPKCHQV